MTKRLLELRDTHRALASGAYTAVDGTGDVVLAYVRSDDDERFLVALNTTGRPASFRLGEAGAGEVVLDTTMSRHGPIDLAAAELGPNEGILIRIEGGLTRD